MAQKTKPKKKAKDTKNDGKPLYKPMKSTKPGKKKMVYVKSASGGKEVDCVLELPLPFD